MEAIPQTTILVPLHSCLVFQHISTRTRYSSGLQLLAKMSGNQSQQWPRERQVGLDVNRAFHRFLFVYICVCLCVCACVCVGASMWCEYVIIMNYDFSLWILLIISAEYGPGVEPLIRRNTTVKSPGHTGWSPQSTYLHRWHLTHCGLNALHSYYQHIETGIKWLPFCRRHFRCFFVNEDCFDQNFTQICSQGPS